MPASLTHIAYALTYRRRRPDDLDEAGLLRGTIFPDVRRAAGIERDLTHRLGVALAEVDSETDAWQAGWLLHSHLDPVWNEFFWSRGLAPDKVMNQLTWRALKMAEDILVFEQILPEERVRLAKIFEAPLGREELESPAPAEAVRAWYDFTAWRLREPYEAASWIRRLPAVGESAEVARKLAPLIEQYRRDPAWQERLHELHRELGM